jgi:hydroxymethylpyrimidine pyrophosphatase-like HAD family hydrolase
MRHHIEALVLDVDGVIVGEQHGVNAPFPHPAVAAHLRRIRSRGISVGLCTVKPLYAVTPIIASVGLANAHITDSGAVVADPLNNEIIDTTLLDNDIAMALVARLVDHGIYTEIYTEDGYAIQNDMICNKTRFHTALLGRNPRFVHSLVDECANGGVIKIMPIVDDADALARAETILDHPREAFAVRWGCHPSALPWRFGIITAAKASKRHGLLSALAHEGVRPAETLAIGDSMSDWEFMAECGYVGTLANAGDELKVLVKARGTRGAIGGDIDDNGVIAVLERFLL